MGRTPTLSYAIDHSVYNVNPFLLGRLFRNRQLSVTYVGGVHSSLDSIEQVPVTLPAAHCSNSSSIDLLSWFVE